MTRCQPYWAAAEDWAAGLAPVAPEFFDQPSLVLARALIGMVLASHCGGQECAGRIVEVEAYLRDGDGAAHSARGPTPAKATLFGPPGGLYVHPMRQRCGLDIVARGGSVLIRALEPLAGLEVMAARRGRDELALLCAGPARLTEALGITRGLDGMRLDDAGCPLTVLAGGPAVGEIIASPRIGISKSAELPLRFHLAGNRFVSRRL